MSSSHDPDEIHPLLSPESSSSSSQFSIQPRQNANNNGTAPRMTAYTQQQQQQPYHQYHQQQQQQQYQPTIHTTAVYDKLAEHLATSTSSSSSSSPSSSSTSTSPPLLRRRFNLVDCFCYYGEKCLDVFVRFLGPVLSCLAIFLISFITYIFFTEVVPLMNARICHAVTNEKLREYMARGEWVLEVKHGHSGLHDVRSGRFIAGADQIQLDSMRERNRELEASIPFTGCTTTYGIVLFGIYLLLSILFHYFCTMFKGPGNPPHTLSQDTQDHLAAHDPEKRDDQQIRWCKICKQVKPMRTHHCRVCGKCCKKMDHHCPWTNTCVGYRNLRHFISFLGFLWTGCLFFIITSYDNAIGVLIGDSVAGTPFLLAVVIAFAALIAGTLFLSWTTYLMCTNQTTIEFYGNQWGAKPGNPYDLGSRTKNIASVFGAAPMSWGILLCPTIVEPPGDGVVFPLSQGRGAPLPMMVDEKVV